MIQYWNYLREYKNQKKNFFKFNKSKMIFSLPIYPSIKNDEFENIIKNINKILLKI